jgi:hypothetical protein
MTGLGPRRGSEADREPAPETVDRDAAAAIAHQFYLDGQRSVTRGGYQAGHDLGHDVGFGVRNDHARQFVGGVLEGHAEGMEHRRQLAEAAERGHAAALARAAHARLDQRQVEAEQEAEAG